jgi:hypothetical protein
MRGRYPAQNTGPVRQPAFQPGQGQGYQWNDKEIEDTLNVINDLIKRLRQIAPELASTSVELTKEAFSRGY